MPTPQKPQIPEDDPSYESPADTAAWEEALTSVDGQELMHFLMAEANDELEKGKFTED